MYFLVLKATKMVRLVYLVFYFVWFYTGAQLSKLGKLNIYIQLRPPNHLRLVYNQIES